MATPTPIDYKTNTYKIMNNEDGWETLKTLRRDVNSRQDNSTITLFNVLLSMAGLFNAALGFASVIFGGAVSDNASQLEELEDMYTTILEDFTTSPAKDVLAHVIIKQRFVCYDLGGDDGVMWKSEDPTYEYGNRIVG